VTDKVDGLDDAQDLRGRPLVPRVVALGHVEEDEGVEFCAAGGLEVAGRDVLIDLRGCAMEVPVTAPSSAAVRFWRQPFTVESTQDQGWQSTDTPRVNTSGMHLHRKTSVHALALARAHDSNKVTQPPWRRLWTFPRATGRQACTSADKQGQGWRECGRVCIRVDESGGRWLDSLMLRVMPSEGAARGRVMLGSTPSHEFWSRYRGLPASHPMKDTAGSERYP